MLRYQAIFSGFTQALTQRLAEHNAGKSPATAPRRPFLLLFCECFATKAEATAREKYLKTTKGHRALKLMLRDALATAIPAAAR